MIYHKIIYSDEYSNSDEIVCYTNKNFEKEFNISHYDLEKGELLRGYSKRILFYYDQKIGYKETDYLTNDLGWPIISQKFKKILDELKVNNVQYIPIEIIEKNTKKVIQGYNLLNIIGLEDVLNLEESIYEIIKLDDEEYISVDNPVLIKNKIKILNLLRVKYYEEVVIISDTLKRKLEENDVTGCDFLEIKVL